MISREHHIESVDVGGLIVIDEDPDGVGHPPC